MSAPRTFPAASPCHPPARGTSNGLLDRVNSSYWSVTYIRHWQALITIMDVSVECHAGQRRPTGGIGPARAQPV